MSPSTNAPAMSPAEMLDWQVNAGADEAIGEASIDRFAISETQKPEGDNRSPRNSTSQQNEPRAVAKAAAPKLNAQAGLAEAETLAAACETIAELEAAVREFDGCSLKKTAMNTVFADGNLGAPIMIIGEAPGADEDRMGKPFVGVSGQLMDRMLAAVGYSRDENLYISNVLPWRPPGNRKPNPQEIALCLPFIRRHIELKAPKLVMFVGGTAAGALLETTQGIMRLRGRWTQLKVGGTIYPAMPTLHPAFLLRQPAMKGLAWRDILEMNARLNAPETNEP